MDNFLAQFTEMVKEMVKEEVGNQVKEQLRIFAEYGFRAVEEAPKQRQSKSSVEQAKGKVRRKVKRPKGKKFENLTPDSQYLYKYLVQFRRMQGFPDATPTYDDVKNVLGFNTVRTSQAYHELVDQGFISREKKGRQRVVRFLTEAGQDELTV